MADKKIDLKALEQKASSFPAQAEKIEIIKDDDSLKQANDFLISIKRTRKEIELAFNPIIKKAHEAHKEALATKKRYDRPLKEAETMIKAPIAAYLAELKRKQREAEEAAQKAEEERKRKEEKQFEAALRAEDDNNFTERDKIMNDPIPEARPVEYTPVPEIKGTSIRKIWKWKIEDFNKIPKEYLQVDASKLGAMVRKTRGAVSVPGIRIYSEDSVTARTK